MNIQLLKASDFNEKLHERDAPKDVTVQRVCRIAKDEREVRELLEAIWENPVDSCDVLSRASEKNKDVYEFEKILQENK